MQKAATSIYGLLNTWLPFVWILLVICVAIVGIGCMIPSEKIKGFCRGHIAWVVIGAALVYCCTSIGKDIAAAFAF